MSVRIITDSTADLGYERAKEWGVTIVPLKVLFGEEEFLDGVELSLDEFYDRLDNGSVLPTTSQPSPEAFQKVFQEVKDAGDEAVVITLSSEISGTYQSACLAADMCDYDRIYVIDSLQVTLSAQLMVKHAVELAKKGTDAKEIANIIEQEKNCYRMYAVIGNLMYLEKGGRLSQVGAAAGSILNLKPVIAMRSDGKVKLMGMSRGMNGAYAKLLKYTDEEGGIDFNRGICIGYTGEREVLAPFEEFLNKKIDMGGHLESRIGTVIGTHGGPGCVVLGCVLNKKGD